MDKSTWGPGIRPTENGKGLRIRVWTKYGTYTETLEGNPLDARCIKAARERRKELEARKKLGIPLFERQKAKLTLFYQDAQDYLDSLDIKHSTSVGYESILNKHLIPEFGRQATSEIQDFKKWLLSLKVGYKTRLNIISVAKGVFNQAGVNMPTIRLKPAQKPPVDRYLPKERDRLLNALTGDKRAFFSIFLGCGARPSEILALEWPDYSGEEFSFTKGMVRRRLVESTKTYRRRKTYVPLWVRKEIDSLPSRFAGGRIFPYDDTEELYEAFKKAHTKARLPYRRPYTCRHTRAAELLSTGVDPADAAKQMGNSLAVFLKDYAEWIDEYSGKRDLARFEGVDRQKTDKVKRMD